MSYIAGWYQVTAWTIKDYPYTKVFPTEQEARAFGNEQYKLSFVRKVTISKMRYYKKRRASQLIAEAEKR